MGRSSLVAAHTARPFSSLAQAENGQSAQVPRVENVELERFEMDYMKAEQPVVLTQAIDHWPALRLWADLDHLRRRATTDAAEPSDEVVVPIEQGSTYLDPEMEHRHVSFTSYLDNLEKAERGTDTASTGGRSQGAAVGYLAQFRLFDAIPSLQQDFEIPAFCRLGRGDYYGTHAWLGPQGTVSPLHKDPYHNCLAQVVGSKYIRIYHPRHQACLYPFADFTRKNSSQVDAENPNLDYYPRFADAPYLECVLGAGQMLYIPKGHWHYVRSLSRSFSISFWWQ